GKSKTVELRFALRADPNAHDGKKSADELREEGEESRAEGKTSDAVELRVSVWDSTYGETVSEQLRVPVREARKAKPENKPLLFAGNDEVLIHAGADAIMPVVGYAKSGASIRSDANFDGWYRVDVGAGVPGYVRDSDIKVTGVKVGVTRKTTVRTIMAHS